ncbi:MAG: acyltransferase, partial [Lachnospiraceae bacterium]|nr:acyltransferase [Lachnospiraceae bacterium]
LMGLATLWVMYNHAMLLGLVAEREPFRFLQLAAHISVDIFFLLSGFGIYHSLEKNSIRDYFLKRLFKLLPVWGSFLVLHIIIDRLVFGLTFSPKEIIGFLTFQGFRAQLGNQGNWYVYTIFAYYLIAPIPYSFLKESKHKLTTCAAMCAICWIASYSYFGNRDLLITFIRIPAFLIGMYAASVKFATEQDGALPDRSIDRIFDRISAGLLKPFRRATFWICTAICLLFGSLHFVILKTQSFDVLWDYGLWWHALIPMALPLSLLLCRGFAAIKAHAQVLLYPFTIIGKASLEIFLMHLYIFKYWGEITGILTAKSVSFRIGIFFLSILLGLLWHLCISFFTGLSKKKSKAS